MRSHSFQLVAVGHVAKQPELKQKGEHEYLNLCLVGNDYGGPDKEEIVTSLFFTAFGKTATALATNVRVCFIEHTRTNVSLVYMLFSRLKLRSFPQKRRYVSH